MNFIAPPKSFLVARSSVCCPVSIFYLAQVKGTINMVKHMIKMARWLPLVAATSVTGQPVLDHHEQASSMFSYSMLWVTGVVTAVVFLAFAVGTIYRIVVTTKSQS